MLAEQAPVHNIILAAPFQQAFPEALSSSVQVRGKGLEVRKDDC